MSGGTNIEDRALSLLGAGVQQEAVASALGVTPGYISQLLSDENFAQQVTQLRFEALTKHNDRDRNYDAIEDKLLDKLERSIPLILRPADILGALKIINAAKRRGVDSVENSITQNNIVQLTMPNAIVQKFTTNIHNQVVKTGDQDLLTIQSGDLLKKAETALETKTQPKLPSTKESIIEENEELALL